MSKLLSTQLSTQTIRFKPGASPQSFDVAVSNLSPKFATFQIELTASGFNNQSSPDWYQLAPELSSKIPAGDRTQFSITIFDVPPVPGGFTGTMTLTVRVFSLELREEDRQVINLIVEGTGASPPTVFLSKPELAGEPGETVEIPIRVQNANRNTANARVTLNGLPPDWIVDGHSRQLALASQGESNVLFLCQLPSASEALSQVYPFEVEAKFSAAAISKVPAQLTVLPSGIIETILSPQKEDDQSLTFSLTTNNQSNVDQEIVPLVTKPLKKFWWQSSNPDEELPQVDPKKLDISPQPLTVQAGDTQDLTLTFTPRRPWLGWRRQLRYSLTPLFSQADGLTLQPPSHKLPILIRPRIPIAIQLLVLGVASALVLGPLLLYATHQGPVNSVDLDGQGNAVISASDDQTIRLWQVRGRRLKSSGRFAKVDKAVRVVRYRPVDNNWVAAGLENGEIKLWNLLTETPLANLLYQKDDRVFDLRFSADARKLFSAHGSGAVLQWDLSAPLGDSTQPQRQQQVDFAVQSLALVGPAQRYLAIAGRFNQLTFWDLDQDTLIPITSYPRGNQTDYITSVAVVYNQPTRFATADNQGTITLWDTDNCLTSGECQQLDQWTNGHDGQPVHDLAFTNDGCYLASSGEDGQVKLWQLDNSGRVMGGQSISQSQQPINSLDIVRLKNKILITSGGEDQKIRLNRAKDDHLSCPGAAR